MPGKPGKNAFQPIEVPLLGQQAASRPDPHRLFLSLFLPMVTQLVPYRAAQGYPVEGGLTEPADPRRVAEEAAGYAHAAMEQLGFVREDEQ